MNTAQARDQALRNAETWSIGLQAAVAPLAGCSRHGHRRGCPGAKRATRLPARAAPPGRGHRPCHSAAPGSGPAGGPKPPASARPAPGGRFAPAGSGAGLCPSRTFRCTGHCPARPGKRRSRFLFPPEQAKGPSTLQWQGPSPLPQRHADPCPAGGQSPRPAPAPPMAGASPPPGRALASVSPGPAGLQGTVVRGRGKRAAFPVPARRDESSFNASMAGAIAPATAPR